MPHGAKSFFAMVLKTGFQGILVFNQNAPSKKNLILLSFKDIFRSSLRLTIVQVIFLQSQFIPF
jgi:hypothetical protein